MSQHVKSSSNTASVLQTPDVRQNAASDTRAVRPSGTMPGPGSLAAHSQVLASSASPTSLSSMASVLESTEESSFGAAESSSDASTAPSIPPSGWLGSPGES